MPADAAPRLAIDVRHQVGDFALQVSAAIALQGVTGLFGPSGSGKSTLLRILAGFEGAARGSVQAGETVWTDSSRGIHLPAYARPVGYLFQDARLFAHLDVRGNLEFAARRSGGGGPRFDDVVAALDLQSLLARDCLRLSGGERQRVALGRTLLCNPQLLLLDEPLAALDARRKDEIIPYLDSIPTRFGIPTVYVSHSIAEIVRLASQVLVLEEGAVSAFGDTAAVLNALQPATPGIEPVASILDTVLVRQLPALHLSELACGEQSIYVPERTGLAAGEHMRLRVRASDVALATSEPRDLSIRNVLRGSLQSISSESGQPFALAVIDVDGTALRCQLTTHAVRELALRPGMPVFALLKTAAFDEHT